MIRSLGLGRSWLSIVLLWYVFCLGVPAAYAAAGDIQSFQDHTGDAWRLKADRTMWCAGNVQVAGTFEVTGATTLSTALITTGNVESLTADNATVNGTVNAAVVNGTQVTATQANVTRFVRTLVAVNATNYSIVTAHSAIYAVVNGNAQNITLPDPNLLENGDEIVIQDQIGQAASNTIAVNSTNTTGAGNINGVAFVNITTAYGAKTYVVRSGKWYAR